MTHVIIGPLTEKKRNKFDNLNSLKRVDRGQSQVSHPIIIQNNRTRLTFMITKYIYNLV